MKQLICINKAPLKGNDVAPPLELGVQYPLIETTADSKGNLHYNVGLVSRHNYITSHETGETLPNSKMGGIHWCHPSRFKETV